jgi:hypothetical protein
VLLLFTLRSVRASGFTDDLRSSDVNAQLAMRAFELGIPPTAGSPSGSTADATLYLRDR